MSVTAHSFAPAATVDWTALITVDQAATLLGCSQGHLSRRCRGELSSRGVAVLLASPETGQRQWYLKREFDARLAAPEPGRNDEPNLQSRFSADQIAAALIRVACVMALRGLREHGRGAMSEQLPALLDRLQSQYGLDRLSERTLRRWDAVYQCKRDLEKLIDTRGGSRIAGGTADAWQAFRDLYLDDRQRSFKRCWQAVSRLAQEQGWRWCSLASCKRQKYQHITAEEELANRQPKLYRTKLEPFIEQDPESYAAGAAWIGDHVQCNFWCWWNGEKIRPWLSSWMDWRSRKLCGWVMSPSPNSTTILAALRHGLLDPANAGGPDHVIIDNGRDYKSRLFTSQHRRERVETIKPSIDEPLARGIFDHLQITPHFAIPYGPNGKARLERFHGTLEAIFREITTYTGNSPDTKPERLAEILAAPTLIPTFEACYERIRTFIAGYNDNADHARADLQEAGIKLSPNQAMELSGRAHRKHDAWALDMLLQKWTDPTTVGRSGVSVAIKGRTFHYGGLCPELSRFKARFKGDRKLVFVSYDPHDVRWIRVFDERMKPVCVAPMNELGGMHGDAIAEERVGELNKRRNAYVRTLKHDPELDYASILTNEEHLAQIAAETPRTAPPAPPAMRLVGTPLDGQGAEAELQRNKQAATAASARRPRRSSVMEKLLRVTPPTAPPAEPVRAPRDPWARATQQRGVANAG